MIRLRRSAAAPSLLTLVLPFLASCPVRPTAVRIPTSLQSVEAGYQELRFCKDQIDVTNYRHSGANRYGVSLAMLLDRYQQARESFMVLAAGVAPESLAPEERRAYETMRQTLGDELVEQPASEGVEAPAGEPDCSFDPARLAGGLAALTERVYACFGRAARQVPFDGRQLDRLTVLGMLAREPDSARRKRLFLSLENVWSAVNGRPDTSSPYRELVRLRIQARQNRTPPIEAKSLQFGIPPEEMEGWLLSILETWRDSLANQMMEPWDFYYETGGASRALSPRIPLNQIRNIVQRYYRSLGADPEKLGVHFDLLPRSEKDPVAFTTFGARNRLEEGRWVTGEFWIFAAYRAGGLDNLAELMHETGHGIHLAGIRTRPAFQDWPDSDPFTEALADMTGLEVYEPEWQSKYLGIAVPTAQAIRNKYAAIVMDIAWALFEIRVHRNPELDPNRVWTEITRNYLRILPHPEISWWAMRGQLVDAPGYMLNYAIGAIIAADLRARVRQLNGGRSFAGGDSGWYARLVEEIYRFGLERPSRQVLEDFLGRTLDRSSLLKDMGRIDARTGSLSHTAPLSQPQARPASLLGPRDIPWPSGGMIDILPEDFSGQPDCYPEYACLAGKRAAHSQRYLGS